jgi:hypothetical protein
MLVSAGWQCSLATMFEVGISCCHADHGSAMRASSVVRAGEAVDLRGPVVEEAALLAAPVLGVRDRLAALLAEWPEHPILAQLTAICDRLLGERCAAPEHRRRPWQAAQALWVGNKPCYWCGSITPLWHTWLLSMTTCWERSVFSACIGPVEFGRVAVAMSQAAVQLCSAM